MSRRIYERNGATSSVKPTDVRVSILERCQSCRQLRLRKAALVDLFCDATNDLDARYSLDKKRERFLSSRADKATPRRTDNKSSTD